MSEQARFFSFGFKVFISISICILLSNVLLYTLTNYSFGNTLYNSLVVLNIIKRSVLVWTLTIETITYIAAVTLIIGISLLMSHRISGPMYRFEKTAEALADGDLTVSARLRDADFMKEQSREFDEAIAGLRGRVSRISELKNEIAGRVEKLAWCLEKGSEREAAELVGEIRAAAEEIGRQSKKWGAD